MRIGPGTRRIRRSPSGAGRPLVCAVALLAAPAVGWAQVAPLLPPPGVPDRPAVVHIEDLSLEELLSPAIWVATKSALHAAQTPAVVTVVTAEEIQTRGYATLADVLRSVPGFYDVYDGVTHNVGIRGINGGQNASGSGVKLMIDGQPVDYGPNSGNFFGEELIPIQAIERVEIIRGPASALYGADAFLGAINVVTRSGESTQGLQLIGEGALVRNRLGGGGGLVMGGKSGPVDVLLAASYLYLDRSGLTLPASSPSLPTITDGMRSSQGDTAEPISVLAKLGLEGVLGGKVTFLASLQHLDSHGQFQYYGPLDQNTRIAALNQNYRLSYEASPVKELTLTLSGNFFIGGPTPESQIGLGRTDYLCIPSIGTSGQGLSAEAHFTPHPMVTVTAGGDATIEDSTTETYDQKLLLPVTNPDGTLLRAAGTIKPGEMHGVETEIRNFGAFVQSMVMPSEQWTGIAGMRLDHHNIYGVHISGRMGAVYSHKALSIKLLYGSSFKAPSPQQLYARPVAFGGVLGNPSLRAQTANSGELAVGIRLPGDIGDIQTNGFVTKVAGRVEFLPTGSYIIANNIEDEWLVGGELVSHFVPMRRLRTSLLASVARTVRRSGTIQGLLGKPQVTNPLFPRYQVGTMLDYALPWGGSRLSADVSYVGKRAASFSNALLRGQPYDVPAYIYSAMAISMAGPIILSGHESRITLRVTDLLDRRWTEPGFGGVDVPTQGITALLTLAQRF